MPAFLGVDIGNTKSHALIADADGHLLGVGTSGSGSPEVLGYEHFGNTLRAMLKEALAQSGLNAADIKAGGFGVAGFDWPSQEAPCLDEIASLNLGGPSRLVNDALVGMLAGAPQGWGIGLVAGTGSNCWGMDAKGHIGRMTGMSHLMDEGGGGSSLVLWALQAVGKAWTMRGPQTLLTDLFLQHFGERDVLALLEKLAMNRELVDASLAPLIMRAAMEEDQVTMEILQRAAVDLASLCLGVARQLKLEKKYFDVVLIGGVFTASELIVQLVRNCVLNDMPGAHLIRLDSPPVVGGVVLATQQAGLHLSLEALERLKVEAKRELQD